MLEIGRIHKAGWVRAGEIGTEAFTFQVGFTHNKVIASNRARPLPRLLAIKMTDTLWQCQVQPHSAVRV